VVVDKSATLICGQHTASYSDFLVWHRLINIDDKHNAMAFRIICNNSAHLNSVSIAMVANKLADNLFGLFRILESIRRLESN